MLVRLKNKRDKGLNKRKKKEKKDIYMPDRQTNKDKQKKDRRSRRDRLYSPIKIKTNAQKSWHSLGASLI